MANEFSGDLLKDVEEFLPVMTEKNLLDAFADKNFAIPTTIGTFAELATYDAVKHALVIAAINETISRAEEMVNGYGRGFGYVLPLLRADGSPDPIAKQVALALVKIDAQERRRIIDAREAEMERDRLTRGELYAISKGNLMLDVARAETAGSMSVHLVTSSPRRFSREHLRGL